MFRESLCQGSRGVGDLEIALVVAVIAVIAALRTLTLHSGLALRETTASHICHICSK
ncbi:hypothetical protein K437DRAFT_260185 [Tilletiaria anomala UBC 951]|uniref:Uncharacterized protein n=1 Tax=Tilletiaria anomala (strain ATCC 24038 / CBS 436.72 / UBC 951) TaxID=1037660 RepID=A0A066V7J2_TILAU|nr:uncharacterized protein K437DRAFT_260185 [Tilletiaria anomala UBC 951]KDN36248.1 hypothetical protein K437DRAFT_260185 [Tilletiaria anomala UBC 951]